MSSRIARAGVQLAALVGFCASVFLFFDYALPITSSACGPGAGCAQVRACSLGQMVVVGLPLWPFVGGLAFFALLIISFLPGAAGRSLTVLGATLGAVGGATLIALQVLKCHAICKYCLIADGSGLVAALFAWMGRGTDPPRQAWRVLVTAGAMVAACVLSYRWYVVRSAPIRGAVVALPAEIAREQRTGLATIVEFADFECPYCRMQQTNLEQVLPAFGTRVRLVRKHVPLHMHRHAEDAARAACCAEEQGHVDDVAHALFTAEPDTLTPEGCAAIVAQHGIDLPAYQSCIHNPRTDARLAADHETAVRSDVTGLPTLFVGNERFDGVVDPAALRASIERALRSAHVPST